MANLRNNRLLLGTALLNGAYWIIAPLIPNPYLSSFFALLILIFGTLNLAQYTGETYRIVVLGNRSTDELGRGKGSHLAVYGIFLFAFGSIYSGAYGLWWNWHGQPLGWIGSASSQYGRACVMVGFILTQAAPEVTKEGFALKKMWMVWALISTILIGIGFYLGMQVKVIESTDAYRALRLCSPGQRVIGTKSRIFHTEASPYWSMIEHPQQCFASEDEAKRAGYRAIKE